MDKRASLEETLEFCNKVREAGGAQPLDALCPAVPQAPSECLVARNLNFSCTVHGGDLRSSFERSAPEMYKRLGTLGYESGDFVWVMGVKDADVRNRIAESMQLPLHGDTIVLPAKIGAVAQAFDDALEIEEKRDKLGREYLTSGDRKLLTEMLPYIDQSYLAMANLDFKKLAATGKAKWTD
jgi:hypothetical protein